MRTDESLAAVERERERESILLLNKKSINSTICNLVNKTIIKHRIQAMYFRRA